MGSRPSAEAPLRELAARLAALLSGDEAAEIEVIVPDQLLLSRHMIANPSRPVGQKTPASVPARNGFQLYVRIQPQSPEDQGRPEQLVRPPEQAVGSGSGPRLPAGDLHGEWQFQSHGGDAIRLAVHLGSDEVREQVDAILREVAAALL
jgi:hypothetical protein